MNIDPHLPIWTNNSSKDMFKIFESNAAPTNQNRKHMEKVFYRLNNLKASANALVLLEP